MMTIERRLRFIRAVRNIVFAVFLILAFGSPFLLAAIGDSNYGIYMMSGFLNGVLAMLTIYWSTKEVQS